MIGNCTGKNNFIASVIAALFVVMSSTAFANSFVIANVTNQTQVYFIVNGTTGYTGVRLYNPAYSLDVVGAVNADDILINGTSVVSIATTTLPASNVTGLSYSHLHSAPNITGDLSSWNNDITLSLSNITGSTSQVCGAGQKITNVTLTNGVISVLCGTDNSGGNISGSGITNYLTKWVGFNITGTSIVYDDGTNIGIGTTSPQGLLHTRSSTGSSGANFSNLAWADHIIESATNAGLSILSPSNSVSGVSFGDNIYATGGKIQYRQSVASGGGATMQFFTNNTERMRIDGQGNIGIGTTSPWAKLDVNGGIFATSGSASAPAYSFSTDSDIGMYRSSANTLSFATNGGEVFRVDTGGITLVPTGYAIGISTDNYLWRDAAGIWAMGYSTNPYELRIFGTSDGATIPGGGTNKEFASLGFKNNANVFTIETEASGTGTVRNIALKGGNVGIGTTTPNYKLDVAGGISGTLYWSNITGAPAIISGVRIPVANVTDFDSYKITTLPYSNITGTPTIPSATTSLPVSNITGDYGTTLNYKILSYANNITGDLSIWNNKIRLDYSNLTNAPTIPNPNGVTIPLTNTTGSTSQECPAGQVLKNVTLSNGVLSSVCTTVSVSPTTSLPAANITAGTFGTGDYTFQNNVVVNRNLTVGTNALFVNTTSGYVGIGRVPYDVLHVMDNMTIEEYTQGYAQLRLYSRGTGTAAYSLRVTDASIEPTSSFMIRDNSNRFVINATGSVGIGGSITDVNMTGAKMVVSSGSNVGIGTTSPGQKLQVVGNIYANSGELKLDQGYSLQFGPNGYYMQSPSASRIGIFGRGSEVMSITNGNVGIGTTSPTTKLQVSNSGSGAVGITIDDTSAGGNDVDINLDHSVGTAADFLIRNDVTGGLRIREKAVADRMRIGIGGLMGIGGDIKDTSMAGASMVINSTSGNVGIGTTNPQQKMSLAGTMNVTSGTTKLMVESNGDVNLGI